MDKQEEESGEVDTELRAIGMCIEALDSVKDNPRALRRVIDFIGSRYIEGLEKERDRLDAEMKVLNERMAYEKYGQLPERLRRAARSED